MTKKFETLQICLTLEYRTCYNSLMKEWERFQGRLMKDFRILSLTKVVMGHLRSYQIIASILQPNEDF